MYMYYMLVVVESRYVDIDIHMYIGYGHGAHVTINPHGDVCSHATFWSV